MTINVALYNLARSAIMRGDYEATSRLLEERVGLSGQTKDRANLAHILEAMSAVAASRGEVERSAVLVGIAEGSLEEAGAPVYSFYTTVPSAQARVVDEAHVALGYAGFGGARERGREMALDEAVAYALSWAHTSTAHSYMPQQPPGYDLALGASGRTSISEIVILRRSKANGR